jgi:putative NADPH-quinone reductase
MAVFAGGQPTPEQSEEWQAVRAVFDRFSAADTHLFSVPMWNGGVPYVLKQWIDIVTQPGWACGFDRVARYSGIVRGKKAAVVYTSGVYSVGASPAFGRDFDSTFFHRLAAVHRHRSGHRDPIATHRARRQPRSGPCHRPRPRHRRRPGLLTRSGHHVPSWAELACCSDRSR